VASDRTAIDCQLYYAAHSLPGPHSVLSENIYLLTHWHQFRLLRFCFGDCGAWHYAPDVFWCCWLGGRKGIRPVKNSGGVLAWLAVCSEVQICIWSNWCHFHSLSIASVKSRLVLVLAHPGNPGRSPESRKMNVCLCLVTVVGWHLSCVLPTDVCYILYRQLCTVECLWQTSRKLSRLTLSVFWVRMVSSVVCIWSWCIFNKWHVVCTLFGELSACVCTQSTSLCWWLMVCKVPLICCQNWGVQCPFLCPVLSFVIPSH